MNFPEMPLLLYPSLARLYGVEESLLYFACKQLFITHSDGQSGPDTDGSDPLAQVTITMQQWLSMTNIWTHHKLDQLCESVQAQQLLSIKVMSNQVLITDVFKANTSAVPNEHRVLATSPTRNPTYNNMNGQNAVQRMDRTNDRYAHSPIKNRLSNEQHLASQAPTQVLPVYDVPPAPPAPPARELPKRRKHEEVNIAPVINTGEILKGIGPAPSFGGSLGWKKRTGDALQTIFDQQEVLNKQLHSMTMDWQPSAMFYSTLSRNNIAQEFANSCLDEFMLFYCDKNKKERSWDQKFLAWVKRAWIQKQSSDNRNNAPQQKTGSSHENSQRDTREKRKRITASIMDIHDTNW